MDRYRTAEQLWAHIPYSAGEVRHRFYLAERQDVGSRYPRWPRRFRRRRTTGGSGWMLVHKRHPKPHYRSSDHRSISVEERHDAGPGHLGRHSRLYAKFVNNRGRDCHDSSWQGMQNHRVPLAEWKNDRLWHLRWRQRTPNGISEADDVVGARPSPVRPRLPVENGVMKDLGSLR